MGKWRRNKSLPKRWIKSHLIRKNGAVCYLCGLPFEKMGDITLDHICPISSGGIDEITNYGLAHLGCNQEKNCMDLDEFKELQRGEGLVE